MGASEIPPPARQITLPGIGFICAMDWEAACLPAVAHVVRAGIGPQRALDAAEHMVAEGAQALISFGSAAGLDPSIDSGALLVTAQVREATLSAATAGEWWRELSRSLAVLEPQAGAIVQCPEVLHTVAQKQALFRTTGAQAADMESAMVARVAARHGLPFAALRVVLDDAATSLPRGLVSACDEYGRVRPGAMAKTLVLSPSLLLSLPGLARAQKRVVNTLTAAGRILANA